MPPRTNVLARKTVAELLPLARSLGYIGRSETKSTLLRYIYKWKSVKEEYESYRQIEHSIPEWQNLNQVRRWVLDEIHKLPYNGTASLEDDDNHTLSYLIYWLKKHRGH